MSIWDPIVSKLSEYARFALYKRRHLLKQSVKVNRPKEIFWKWNSFWLPAWSCMWLSPRQRGRRIAWDVLVSWNWNSLENRMHYSIIFLIGFQDCDGGRNQGVPQAPQCTPQPNPNMWYFKRDTKECLRMTFHGCFGNSNRYCSKEHCLKSCNRPTPRPN